MLRLNPAQTGARRAVHPSAFDGGGSRSSACHRSCAPLSREAPLSTSRTSPMWSTTSQWPSPGHSCSLASGITFANSRPCEMGTLRSRSPCQMCSKNLCAVLSVVAGRQANLLPGHLWIGGLQGDDFGVEHLDGLGVLGIGCSSPSGKRHSAIVDEIGEEMGDYPFLTPSQGDPPICRSLRTPRSAPNQPRSRSLRRGPEESCFTLSTSSQLWIG